MTCFGILMFYFCFKKINSCCERWVEPQDTLRYFRFLSFKKINLYCKRWVEPQGTLRYFKFLLFNSCFSKKINSYCERWVEPQDMLRYFQFLLIFFKNQLILREVSWASGHISRYFQNLLFKICFQKSTHIVRGELSLGSRAELFSISIFNVCF